VKVYKAVFKEGNQEGVYAVSLVSNPAMQDHWIALAEENPEIQFEAVDEDRKLLLGAALIPEKRILRRTKEGDEFFMFFEAATIEKIAHAFQRNKNQSNASEQHERIIDGATVVETWLVEDPEKDKSAAFGKTYQKGTWVVMMSVENSEVWEKAKKGELKGFSVEAILGLDKTGIEMAENKSIKELIEEKFSALLKELRPNKVDLGEVTLKDGKTKLIFEGETPQVGKAIFIKPEKGDDEKIAAPTGEHELENGEKLFVDKDGLIADKPEENPEDVQGIIDKKVKEVETMMSAMKAAHEKEIKALKVKLSEAEQQNEKLEKKLEAIPSEEEQYKSTLKFNEEPKTMKERLANTLLKAQNSN